MHNLNTARLIYFSPTQTTRRILENIAQGMQIAQVDVFDLTSPAMLTRGPHELWTDLAIIGMPVYGGRLPAAAVQRLRQYKGLDTPAVIVVVYGNREFDDALLELKDLAMEIGCRPVAAAAFIGEHSFSNQAELIAPGRPDAMDLRIAADFGRQVRDRLHGVASLDQLPALHVPGSFPYREYPGNAAKACPTTEDALCQRCAVCASVCPTGAIQVNGSVATDPAACILCCACVKACSSGGRVMDHPAVNQSRTWLATHCQAYKDPQVFI